MNLRREILVFTLILTIFALIQLAQSNLCHCSHCDDDTKLLDTKENNLAENGDDNNNDRNETDGMDDEDETTMDYQLLLKEDFDGDGILTICARDRDHEDRSFPSICHMLCHNACTEFNSKENKENNGTYDVMAYRTNYYKLYDGPCRRHYT
ncbi:uncharacterized protein LOC123275414 isoform X1 [Cotesia glomerata]|uniref:Uncharacterized protein n=1 Tax=Cotesia glomerata TaxID=32391 RepID=A0AAV7J4A3_COTGL|nr:uncharacterized protein LOC123275414 isoform X1 [Cotesia glomerata]KAH0566924.1 hypothetical protein KQX54_005456 [Cotesia glomerata]